MVGFGKGQGEDARPRNFCTNAIMGPPSFCIEGRIVGVGHVCCDVRQHGGVTVTGDSCFSGLDALYVCYLVFPMEWRSPGYPIWVITSGLPVELRFVGYQLGLARGGYWLWNLIGRMSIGDFRRVDAVTGRVVGNLEIRGLCVAGYCELNCYAQRAGRC